MTAQPTADDPKTEAELDLDRKQEDVERSFAGPGERLEILSPDGTVRPGTEAPMSTEQVRDALRWMMLSRTVDVRAISLQRQGRMGTFSAVRGQEASVVGSSFALDPARDWIVPQYRELPGVVRHGFPLDGYLLYWMGNPAGGRVPDGVKVLPLQIALAAQLPHAVGLGWGLKLQGSESVVATYFGDGASSEGDSHEAMNLAGVMRAPVVFFLQNNGWAISTPRTKQTAAANFASRAEGYGFPGVIVDGNDLFAVYAAMREAVERARTGGGPTLIESQTYRMGAHNTADDPTRYMEPVELSGWDERDPIRRVTAWLRSQDAWDDDAEREMQAGIDRQVDEAIESAEAFAPPNPEQIYTHVYADPPERLRAQQRAALDSH
ncbi:pyruvate dehydrogenase (acetyl-transferring) E1 component subunit alpha [Blastococcus sp. BMG 814]|uniref:Pyruvate dehydrogenase (Acetyl-transferring) E1 component subunit alpha n=1 Tax=Blastococcus carthaginiensis TaxID=3050034 RepID=A0ABT9IAS2_9ACTN|nr:pyruvate dehydrogenase (acetyl-transferring) E1 component subunit alpha [Blastococcus carthaginiensis]MDP5182671.1 pyruvate dehydrogenase (acetyl-transferring) E1 component subunit alpha [Blastococcus carthaginiensis]